MRRLALILLVAACGGHPSPQPAPLGNRARTSAAPAPPLLPGSVGLSIEVVRVDHACTDHRTQVRVIAAGDDPAFAAAISFEPPLLGSGKDGGPVDHHQLEAWVREWTHHIRVAQDHLSHIALDDRAPAQARVEAIARLVQLYDLAGDEILAIGAPPGVADTPDLLQSYCGALSAQTDTMSAKADDTRARCRSFAERLAVGDGWWTAVCAGPAGPHPP